LMRWWTIVDEAMIVRRPVWSSMRVSWFRTVRAVCQGSAD
jgi:hypothetical protein